MLYVTICGNESSNPRYDLVGPKKVPPQARSNEPLRVTRFREKRGEVVVISFAKKAQAIDYLKSEMTPKEFHRRKVLRGW